MTGVKAALSKVPEVTLGFWIIKILATTLGETGGDAVTMSLLHADKDAHNGGYLIGADVFMAVFVAAVPSPNTPAAACTAFQIRLAPSADTCTDAQERTPRWRKRLRQLRRKSFAVAIIANANTIVAAGRRCLSQTAGDAGAPDCRF